MLKKKNGWKWKEWRLYAKIKRKKDKSNDSCVEEGNRSSWNENILFAGREICCCNHILQAINPNLKKKKNAVLISITNTFDGKKSAKHILLSMFSFPKLNVHGKRPPILFVFLLVFPSFVFGEVSTSDSVCRCQAWHSSREGVLVCMRSKYWMHSWFFVSIQKKRWHAKYRVSAVRLNLLNAS